MDLGVPWTHQALPVGARLAPVVVSERGRGAGRAGTSIIKSWARMQIPLYLLIVCIDDGAGQPRARKNGRQTSWPPRNNQVSTTESGFNDTLEMPSSMSQRAKSG